MDLSVEDRRESPRVPCRLYVRGMDEEREWSEELGDLSLGGVGFLAGQLPQAERLLVSFAVPGEQTLRSATASVVRARVEAGAGTHQRHFALGLRFEVIEEEDELAIARALDRVAQSY